FRNSYETSEPCRYHPPENPIILVIFPTQFLFVFPDYEFYCGKMRRKRLLTVTHSGSRTARRQSGTDCTTGCTPRRFTTGRRGRFGTVFGSGLLVGGRV